MLILANPTISQTVLATYGFDAIPKYTSKYGFALKLN